MNVALVFAGGSGTRMRSNGIPKQFLKINGMPIIIRTLEHFEHHPDIDAICVVCIEGWINKLNKYLKRYEFEKVRAVIPGGKDGQESIRNGLYCIRDTFDVDDDSIVLIHDGVRPLINEQLITNNINSVKNNGSAITVVPAIETIVRVNDNKDLIGSVDRTHCCIARAPQSFYLKDILAAHAKALEDGVASTMVDSASLMLYCGYKLSVVEGPMENIKVTTPMDFYTCRAFFEKQEDSQILGI